MLHADAAGTGTEELGRQLEQRVQEFTLSNGLHFLVLERHNAPIVSCHTYADVGAFDEEAGQTGGSSPMQPCWLDFPARLSISLSPLHILMKADQSKLCLWHTASVDNQVLPSLMVALIKRACELCPPRAGIAHLLEHMAFKGSPRIGTRDFVREAPLLNALDEGRLHSFCEIKPFVTRP